MKQTLQMQHAITGTNIDLTAKHDTTNVNVKNDIRCAMLYNIVTACLALIDEIS